MYKDPEDHRAYYCVWYEENKQKRAAYSAVWYKTNIERKRATARAWRKANKERKVAAYRAWAEANKEQKAVSRRAYRARKKGAVGLYTKQDIECLWKTQLGKCAVPHCGTSLAKSCTVDHIVPLSRRGTNWPSNIQLLCLSCNSAKGSR